MEHAHCRQDKYSHIAEEVYGLNAIWSVRRNLNRKFLSSRSLVNIVYGGNSFKKSGTKGPLSLFFMLNGIFLFDTEFRLDIGCDVYNRRVKVVSELRILILDERVAVLLAY